MPTPEENSEKRLREMNSLTTASQRAAVASARAWKEAFERMERAGSESEREISKHMLDLLRTSRFVSAEAASTFAAKMHAGIITASPKMQEGMRTVLKKQTKLFSDWAIDTSHILGRAGMAQSAAAEGDAHKTEGRIDRLARIAKANKVDEVAFVLGVMRNGTEQQLKDMDRLQERADARYLSSKKEAADQVVFTKETGRIEREVGNIIGRSLKDETVGQTAVAKAREAAEKPLHAALSGKGAGSQAMRAIGGTAMGDRMLKAEADKAAGVAVPGFLGTRTATVMGEGMGAIAGLLNALAPLGVELAVIGGIFRTIFTAFDRTKQTGAAAFIAASTGARQYGNVLGNVATLGKEVNAATEEQRMQAMLAGVNIDELSQKSLGALAGMGTAVGAGNIGAMTAALNEVQALATGAGMSAEQGLGLAAQGQRAFNLNTADKMTNWFRTLRESARAGGQSMEEFVGSMGDFSSMANKFGDQGTSMITTFAGMSKAAKAAGLSQTGMAMFEGVGAQLASMPLRNMMALSIAGRGGGISAAAGGLNAANAKAGTGGVIAYQLESFQKFIQRHPNIAPSDTDPRKNFLFGQAITHFFGEAVGSKVFFDPKFRKVMAGGTGGREVQSQIASAVKDGTEAGQMLTVMGAQKGSLEQLVGIVKETAIMLATSTLFSGTDASRHIIDANVNARSREHARNMSALHAGKKH